MTNIMRRMHYNPVVNDYEKYYLNQAGYGGIPVYRGVGVMRGYGLGNILASAFRSAMPMLKRGAEYLGKKALVTGAKVVTDVASGIPITTALKSRAINAGKESLLSARNEVKEMTGLGLKKKRRATRRITSVKSKKKKTTFPSRSDIFS